MYLTRELLDSVIAIAVVAGEEILDVYERDETADVQTKDDNSPLTEADLRAHRHIVSALHALTPDVPVLSEESESLPFAERSRWQTYWLVDPLDGTKEFIQRNGEFTVNIALVRDGEPMLGVVHVPVQGMTYSGLVGDGAWRRHPGEEEASPIQTRSLEDARTLRVVASRRHGAEALEALLQRLSGAFAEVEQLSMGSSLKICVIAAGGADFYPRLAPTSEWDTAAAHAVLRAAGGEIYDTRFQPLRYGRKDSLLNPFFLAVGDAHFDWLAVCGSLPES